MRFPWLVALMLARHATPSAVTRPDIHKSAILVALHATTYTVPADMSLETPTSESDIEVREKRGRSPCLARADCGNWKQISQGFEGKGKAKSRFVLSHGLAPRWSPAGQFSLFAGQPQKTATRHSPVDASVANPADAFFFVY